jgi:hypothetical protein
MAAYTTIKKPKDYFNTVTYTGNGGSQSITGVGHQPDWVWIKKRNGAADSSLMDVVRGVRKSLRSNKTNGEYTESSGLSSFDSDGFSFDGSGFNHVNTNSDSFVGWCWKAGNSQGSSNTDGTINTTYTSVNTTAGFSISKYTGNATAGATIGHGLGAVPKMIIVKKTNAAKDWNVYHAGMGATKGMYLNLTNAEQTHTNWNNTTPTSSVFSIGSDDQVNGSGQTYITYCFAEKRGFSKFGTYTGNGNADGAFVYTGFKPAFTLIKRISSGDNWAMHDNRRPGRNPNDAVLRSNLADAEYGGSQGVDYLSNGFKARQNDGEFNNSGETYIFMAFAEEPLIGDNPATAR